MNALKKILFAKSLFITRNRPRLSFLRAALIALTLMTGSQGFAAAPDEPAAQVATDAQIESVESPQTQTVEAPEVPEEPVVLSVEALKKKVIELNRDLFILEEDLLFPANTQFVVFLSLDTGKFLALDAVKLKVDDEIVAAHLYTERQQQALARGGMQRLHIGNLKQGWHEVTVVVDGIGPDQRPVKLAQSMKVEKGTELKALEIRIRDQSSNFQPGIELVEWETE